jgi:6-pyruvoyltetrahydropterin/6-carboxytetrahydropterin synthase
VYELKIVGEFAAAHHLRNFRGKCESLHGHNWKVEVVIAGRDLDESGVVLDFAEIKAAAKEVLAELDHRYLNDLPFFTSHNPSSENIARYLFQRLGERLNNQRVKVTRVSAWESEGACATYLDDDPTPSN